MRRCRSAARFAYAYFVYGILFLPPALEKLGLTDRSAFPGWHAIGALGPSLRVRLRGHEPFEGKVLVPNLGPSKRFPSAISYSAQIGKPPP